MQCLNLKWNTRWWGTCEKHWRGSLKTLKTADVLRASQQIWAGNCELVWEKIMNKRPESKPLLSPWFGLRKCSSTPMDLAAFFPFVRKWRKRLIVGSERIMWHNDCVCLNDGYTACSNVTYVPSTRNMFDIVLGAQARSHVTVVHFFGDYLNLQHSTAGRGGGRDAREDQVREGRQQRTQAEASKSN